LDALICNACGDTVVLDRRDVVAAAEIVLFVEAHCGHPRVSIDFYDPAALHPSSSVERRTWDHHD